ncbi:MAG: YopX family protein [Spirochaetes bacterium]|nr:YopX family protein [Spirochaetota bacterium]
MRDFSYRIFLKKLDKMIYITGLNYVHHKVMFFIQNKKSPLFPQKDVVIMQATGFKDCNHIKIFEGDIVEVPTEREKHRYVVSWKEDYAAFGFEYVLIDTFSLSWQEESLPQPQFWRVIGNIHENKDIKI